jgi:hypothetical protein
VDADTRGDPELPLRWTSKGARKVAAGLVERGHRVNYQTVARLLRALGTACSQTASGTRVLIIPIATRSLRTST